MLICTGLLVNIDILETDELDVGAVIRLAGDAGFSQATAAQLPSGIAW